VIAARSQPVVGTTRSPLGADKGGSLPAWVCPNSKNVLHSRYARRLDPFRPALGLGPRVCRYRPGGHRIGGREDASIARPAQAVLASVARTFRYQVDGQVLGLVNALGQTRRARNQLRNKGFPMERTRLSTCKAWRSSISLATSAAVVLKRPSLPSCCSNTGRTHNLGPKIEAAAGNRMASGCMALIVETGVRPMTGDLPGQPNGEAQAPFPASAADSRRGLWPPGRS